MKQDKKHKKMIDDYNKGIICVCPICLKVDINPNVHYKDCDPSRIERMDHEGGK